MRRLITTPLIVATCFLFTGCAGTLYTRAGVEDHTNYRPEYASFGAYPYEAVVTDFRLMSHPQSFLRWDERVHGFISVPLDFALDTVALPIDLVCWPFDPNKNHWVNHGGKSFCP